MGLRRLFILGLLWILFSHLQAEEAPNELADVSVGVGVYPRGYYRYSPYCGPNGYYAPGYYGRRYGAGFYFGPWAGRYYRPRCYNGYPRYYYYPYWGPGWRSR